ncbi:ABC transporter permease [Actinophytocola sp.]|uniref:ABC transporter permease n=1 Tax=Actinophytocola sp. TaxID=1872138 RepID=UPI002D7E578C|nr:ABC transporter permease [Actinophytocola sp.]HET9139543.1 ABC transporter permease [Actinophytocola sp.]
MIRGVLARVTWDKIVPVLLLLTLVIGMQLEPRFGRGSTFAFIVQDIGEIMIIAFAMTLVIMTGEIDLSVASTAALASCVLGWAFERGIPIWIAVLLALVTGVLCGAVNGLLVTAFGLPSLAVTIGTLALFRGLCWALLGDEPVASYPESWTRLGSGRFPHTYIPYVAPLLIAGAIGYTVLLHATRTGRWIVAIGQSPEAATFAGIPVARVKLWLFVHCGLLSAVAGVVYTMRFASSRPDAAIGFELLVIAAVLFGGVSIFGGVGTMWGVISAVLFLGALRSLLLLQKVPPNALNIINGALLLASVVVPAVIAAIPRRRRRSSDPGVSQGHPTSNLPSLTS